MARWACAAAAVSVAAACDPGSLQTSMQAMETTCCAGQDCTSGLPAVCDEACAPVFNDFWEDCGGYLNFLPGTEGFTDFYQACQTQTPSTTASACDTGNLITLMFFSCADVNQNNPNTFCQTPCFHGVHDFVGRCAKSENEATKSVFNQARNWMSMCPDAAPTKSCHALTCGGAMEGQCQTARTEHGCGGITAADTPVACKWQTCDDDKPPPPPPPGIAPPPAHPPAAKPGCMDPTALNFDEEATVQADGACLYSGVGPVDPGFGQNCSPNSPYGCTTQVMCEASKNQWVPCQQMQEYQHCSDCCEHSQGQCVRPCSANQPENCYTEADCRSAGAPQQVGAQGGPAPTTQWYVPQEPYMPPGMLPPGVPPPPPPSGRCDRACTARNLYECRTEAACTGVGKQWKPPARPIGAGDDVEYMEPGRCEEPCDEHHFSNCNTQQACQAVGKQWTYSQCCGQGCPPNGIGRCEEVCTEQHPYSCRTQISCESIGRQWVPEDDVNPLIYHGGSDSARTCTGTQNAGSCSAPCMRDNSYNCHTQVQCEAVGLEWHAPVTHTNPNAAAGEMPWTEPGHCSYPCSLMNPDECDSEDECKGIGFSWVIPSDEGFGPYGPIIDPGFGPMIPECPDCGATEGGRQGFCEAPCSSSNPSGCQSQGTCEHNGNQWVVEHEIMPVWEDGAGGVVVDPMPMPVPNGGHGRRLHEIDVDPEPVGRTFAHCEEACSGENIYACRSEDACTGVGGKWQSFDRGPVAMDCPDCPQNMGGSCEPGCSVENQYQCQTQAECEGIDGQWQQREQNPNFGNAPVVQHFCNVTLAGCSLESLVGTCASSTAAGHASWQLCDADCGRFIVDNYARCQRSPPAGMTKTQFTEQFGPIVQMCRTVRSDPQMERCASTSNEAVSTMNRVCCGEDNKDCSGNNGVPTHCTGDCAAAFLPYFETCGPMLMAHDESSSLAEFYSVCTSSGSGARHDPKLCSDNSGNSPWVAIDFRSGCSVWVKYIDAKTQETSDFVRLVSVGSPPISVAQLLDVAKDVCGKTDMVKRFAEDPSGIMALSDIPGGLDTVALTVNHPTAGNIDVTATNSGANRDAVHKQWKSLYSVRLPFCAFAPEICEPDSAAVGHRRTPSTPTDARARMGTTPCIIDLSRTCFCSLHFTPDL